MLTGPTLANMYALGADMLCIILNTANCDQSGTHWVSFVIDIQNSSLELFDSTGEYSQELTPVREFAKFLTTECTNVFGRDFKFISTE